MSRDQCPSKEKRLRLVRRRTGEETWKKMETGEAADGGRDIYEFLKECGTFEEPWKWRGRNGSAVVGCKQMETAAFSRTSKK